MVLSRLKRYASNWEIVMRKLFNVHIPKRLWVSSLLVSSFLMVSGNVFAATPYRYDVCAPTTSAANYNFILSGGIDAAFNKAGVELPSKFTWNEGKSYQITCTCTPGQRIGQTYYWGNYYTTGGAATGGHAPGWHRVNEYIDIKVYVAIWDQSINDTVMHEVPFNEISNKTPEGVCPNTDLNSFGKSYIKETITSGGKGKIDVYIKKPFVGRVSHSVPWLLTLQSSLDVQVPGQPIAMIGVSIDITAPQSCEINAGQSISIPFNNVPQRAFVTAGKGGMPAGVVPQSKTLSIKCSNMDAYANLDMRFIGTADSNRTNDGFSTDNKDIAIAIEGPNGRLTPTTGKLPLQLDSNQNGSVTIKTYPFSSTGLAPAVGKYSSIVTVRLDFR